MLSDPRDPNSKFRRYSVSSVGHTPAVLGAVQSMIDGVSSSLIFYGSVNTRKTAMATQAAGTNYIIFFFFK